MNRRNNNTSSPSNSRPNRNIRRNPRQNRSRRRNITNRRNRRFGQTFNRRNRLARAQYISRYNIQNRRRRFVFRKRTRMNLRLRKLFIGNLHKSITNRQLYNLFKKEGNILGWKVFYNRNGFSRGFGILEFDRPRDAWKAIQKWNNTFLKGNKIRVEYKNSARRRINRRRGFRNNVNNNKRFNYVKNNNYQNKIRNVNNRRNMSRYYYY